MIYLDTLNFQISQIFLNIGLKKVNQNRINRVEIISTTPLPMSIFLSSLRAAVRPARTSLGAASID